MASLTQTINRGVALLQEGKPDRAATLYRQVLERSPDNPDALHLLSVATFQQGDAARAATLAQRAIERAPGAADYHSNLGRYYLSLGRLHEAVTTLERALALAPGHAQARFNLAAALGASRRWQDSLAHLEEYIRLKPDDPGGHHQLGLALSELGRAAQAVPHFCRTVELSPAAAEAYNNLGNAMQAIGQAAEAIAFYEQALRIRPAYPDAMANLGAAHQALGQRDRALDCFHRALALEPGSVHARGNIANLEAAEGRHEQAAALFRVILADAPESAETWNNLGNSRQELGDYEAALASYGQALTVNPGYYLVHNNIGNTLRRQGRYEEAIAHYDRALAARADFVEAINNRAVALMDLGRTAEAMESYERAQSLRPDYPDPFINMGNVCRDHGRPERAIGLYRRAIAVAPGNAFAWNNLGCALSDQGEIAEAIECFERSLAINAASAQTHSNLLLNLHYDGAASPEQIWQAHREHGERHGREWAQFRAPHTNRPDPERPLRVGYVSADFRRHSVAYFAEPVIERHDRAGYDVYLYADVARPDKLTERFAALAGSGWRDIRGYNAGRFAALARADEIDILVDLGAHTANSRLSLFTARPAPVQVTWLGYPDTTGLDSIGYRITDACADPPGQTERWHCEELVRLDTGFLCFRPPAEAPPPAPAPSLAGAPFTFGSFNNQAKLSDKTVALWAEILHRVTGSRLAIKNKALAEEPARARQLARFARHGIGAERLWMSGAIDSFAGHLSAYGFVDVALDTFPYNGTTTTCEALWMGVPVVTLAGKAHVARTGASLLMTAGLGDLVAARAEEYVSKAAALAGNPVRLGALRASLRARVAACPLTAEGPFTRELEKRYRALWRRWCEGQS